MIEQILNRENMMHALRRVKSNKGSYGTDGMKVSELYPYWVKHREEIEHAIRTGQYQPSPIRGKEIPKKKNKKRLLGIPTVVDRMVQQATGQVVALKFEMEFDENSYGFRPNRNAQQAVQKSQEYINAGNGYIVDIDLKSFFDEVDHCLLLNILYRKIKCKQTMCLIRRGLRAPIEINGHLVKRRKGLPQGSPLSPLLSNIMLHELDKEMKQRGLKYVRYADDFSVYTNSETKAKEIGNELYLFLKNKLRLPINWEKSGIRKPVHFTILGYGFVPTYVKGEKGKYQLVINDEGWKKLKLKMKAVTRKTTPMSIAERIEKLKEIQRGWLGYFRMANISGKLRDIDRWIRNRLRYCIWHNWKKPERRRKNLLQLGVDPEHAYSWSRSRMGGWAIAQSPILGTTVTLERLQRKGYESMQDYYRKNAPHLNEPLYTRTVRTVV